VRLLAHASSVLEAKMSTHYSYEKEEETNRQCTHKVIEWQADG
jgi:hypothetical protein